MADQRPVAVQDDVVELLIQQHGEIHDLFDEVRTCEGDARRRAFDRLVRLLAVHESAEEMIVHPLARTVLPGGADVVDDRLAEEKPAKEMLSRLDTLGPEDPRFPPLLEELRLAVLAHGRAEERYEFVKLREEIGADALTELATAVRAAESLAPTHPHPSINTATENLLAGPVAAVVDRVRDSVRPRPSDAT